MERVAEFQVETQNLYVEQVPVQSKQIAPAASGKGALKFAKTYK